MIQRTAQSGKRSKKGRKIREDSIRCNKATYMTVSFPKSDVGLLELMKQKVSSGVGSFSELVRTALWKTYGGKHLEEQKIMILDLYADRELEGPRLFSKFEDVLEWEIKNKSISEIKELWHISGQDLGVLLLEYSQSFDL